MAGQDQYAHNRLLLMSNSTNYGESFLAYPEPIIKAFLGSSIKTIIFLPFAGVSISYQDYADKVRQRFDEMGYDIIALHDQTDKTAAIQIADAIMVGGGNTFQLLHEIYRYELLEPIRQAISSGKPYLGWSAGSNLACPTIMTTNDMPIVNPPSLEALGLVPFQINPHFIDAKPEGHGGESRADRLNEFITVNKHVPVVGLYEGSILQIVNSQIAIIGEKPVRIFQYGCDAAEIASDKQLQKILYK